MFEVSDLYDGMDFGSVTCRTEETSNELRALTSGDPAVRGEPRR